MCNVSWGAIIIWQKRFDALYSIQLKRVNLERDSNQDSFHSCVGYK